MEHVDDAGNSFPLLLRLEPAQTAVSRERLCLHISNDTEKEREHAVTQAEDRAENKCSANMLGRENIIQLPRVGWKLLAC